MRHAVALLTLVACTQPAQQLPTSTAPPPVLQGAWLLRGVPTQVRVTDLPVGANVGLVGTTTPSGPRSCPPQIAPLCLDLANPIRLLGTTRANARGEATFSVTVPAALPLPAVRLQAAAPTAGQVSNAATFRLLDPAADDDQDGLSNQQEHNAGLHPLSADSDGDRLDDGDEVALGTDPRDPDTDGGGAGDGDEEAAGLDPLDPADDRCVDGSCIVDCAGVLGGPATRDVCGVCDADPSNNCCPTPAEQADADLDGVIACYDCDDQDNRRGPGFPEACDGVDNDCDGQPGPYEDDFDQDGTRTCVDCDDGNPTRGPGFPELCDGLDNDCDGQLPPFELDGDQDGLMACRECDDTTAARRPGLAETCDGLDNDCDPATTSTASLVRKTRVQGPVTTPSFAWPTALRQGVTLPAGTVLDVDLFLSVYHPSLSGVDAWLFPPQGAGVLLADNEGGMTATLFDDDGPRSITDPLSTFTGRVRPENPLAPLIGRSTGGRWEIDVSETGIAGGGVLAAWRLDIDMALTGGETDADGDGLLACDGDCDDSRADVRPGRPELCDGVDNNCDGVVPANEQDVDGDNALACAGDCDDSRWEVRPGATEVCDGLDNDCDFRTSSGNERDQDGDSWFVCMGDCDDYDSDIYPGAPEVCDGDDNDCDGHISSVEVDHDYDGWRQCAGDCGPASGMAYPGSPSLSDAPFVHSSGSLSWDYNCDGTDTRFWTQVGAPCGGAFWVCSYTEGWDTTVPDCGQSNRWFWSCPAEIFCSIGEEVTRTQICY
jgi:hypothetical protein